MLTILKQLIVVTLLIKMHSALPSLLSSSFINSFERILVEWNEDVAYSLPYRNCSTIVDIATLESLGTSPICIATSRRNMMIILGKDAFIQKGDSFRANRDIFSPGNVRVTAIEGESPPVISVNQRESLCKCIKDSIWIDIDMSDKGSYSGLVNITWGVTEKKKIFIPEILYYSTSTTTTTASSSSIVLQPPEIEFPFDVIYLTPTPSSSAASSYFTPIISSSIAPTPFVPANLSELEISLLSQNGKTQIKLNLSMFEDDFSYTISVMVKNAFNTTAEKNISLHFRDNCAPYVSVTHGSLLDRFGKITFQAHVFYPSCWVGGKVPRFRWFLDVPGVDMNNYRSNIFVPTAKTFSLNQAHQLKVNVSIFNTSDVITVLKQISFEFKSRPLVAWILGDYREIPVNERIVLNGYFSFDPDNRDDDFTYEWMCQGENGERCYDGDEMADTESNILELESKGGNFHSNKIYSFTLFFFKEGRISNDSIKIKFVNGSLPNLYVFSTKMKYSPEEAIVFFAEISGKMAGTYYYSWRCYDKYDSNKTEKIPHNAVKEGIIRISEPSYFVYTVKLHLHGNSIEFGTSLSCRCTVTYNSASVEAGDTIFIDIPIRNAILEMDPSFGEAIKTEFRLRAYGWSDYHSNKPLLFRFGYKYPNSTQSQRYISTWSSSNILEDVYLPMAETAVNETTCEVIMFVEIRNAHGALAYVEKNVSLSCVAPETNASLVSHQHYLHYDQFKAVQYLYNLISVRDNLNVSDEIDSGVVSYLNLFLFSPFIPDTLQMVIKFSSHFIEVSSGKLTPTVLLKLKHLMVHLADNVLWNVKESTDLMEQARDVISMLNLLLHVESSKYHLMKENVASNLLYKYGGQVCKVLETIPNDDDGYLISSPLFTMFALNERKFENNENTVLAMTKSLIEKLFTWECSPSAPKGCHGYCLTDIKYDWDLFTNETWRPDLITDIHHIELWNPNAKVIKAVEIFEEDEYLIQLNVKNKTISVDDKIECKIKSAYGDSYDAEYCTGFLVEVGSFLQASCRCKKLGMIGAFKSKIVELPGETLNYTLYFYAPDDTCTNGKKYGRFRFWFKTSLVKYILEKEGSKTKLSPRRIKITGCEVGSVILHFYILDDVKEMRNPIIQAIVDRLIVEQMFIVEMKQNNYHLFDINQTTPKPPPPTIPPIGEVTVDWIPIGIAIGLILFVFVCCGIAIHIHHTRLLKKKVYTGINSDKKEKELSEEEQIELANRKTRDRTMSRIMKDAIDEDKNLNSSRLSLWSLKSNRVHPLENKSGEDSSSNYFHESAMLDSFRLALDESSDDEDTPNQSRSSKAEMFRASSSISETGNASETPVPEVNNSQSEISEAVNASDEKPVELNSPQSQVNEAIDISDENPPVEVNSHQSEVSEAVDISDENPPVELNSPQSQVNEISNDISSDGFNSSDY